MKKASEELYYTRGDSKTRKNSQDKNKRQSPPNSQEAKAVEAILLKHKKVYSNDSSQYGELITQNLPSFS